MVCGVPTTISYTNLPNWFRKRQLVDAHAALPNFLLSHSIPPRDAPWSTAWSRTAGLCSGDPVLLAVGQAKAISTGLEKRDILAVGQVK